MKNVKIICNKADFAKMVKNCCRSMSCSECVLDDICVGTEELPFLNLVEVIEETKPPEKHMCITCNSWRAGSEGAVCANENRLDHIDPYTVCNYWEPVEMIKVGGTDDDHADTVQRLRKLAAEGN